MKQVLNKEIKIVVKWRVRKIDHISKLVRQIAVRRSDLVVYTEFGVICVPNAFTIPIGANSLCVEAQSP